MRICRVPFTTTLGIRHSAEIQADSLYEAAVEGVKAISEQWGEQPGPVTPIAVEVKGPTVTHELTLKQIRQWLNSGCNSPKDKLIEDRLRQNHKTKAADANAGGGTRSCVTLAALSGLNSIVAKKRTYRRWTRAEGPRTTPPRKQDRCLRVSRSEPRTYGS